jgi:ABC-type phosphate/phosphonate transport system substrate-binding protein
MDRRRFLAVGLTAALASAAGFQRDRKFVRIGLVESLFADISENTLTASMDQFRQIMERETGHNGESVTVKDCWTLADELARKELQLGALSGFEYAWVREKHPDLRPLVVAVNQELYARSLLMVGPKSAVKTAADLVNQTLAIPKHTRAYSTLFLHRQVGGKGDNHYSGKTTKPENVEEALDDAVDGEVAAALVDSVSLARYKARKPVRFARLRVLAESPPFPPTAVIYQRGALDDETLERFRRALLNLNQNPDGREILLTWKQTAFEPVPEDYTRRLEEIAKAYPRPSK